MKIYDSVIYYSPFANSWIFKYSLNTFFTSPNSSSVFYTLIEKVAFFNHYSNFGSGLDEIKGNKKTDVKLQSIFSFLKKN